MRITSRGFAAVTVGLVSAVVLAGCSSNSTKPTVLPSLQTTAAPSTPSPAATTPAVVATSAVVAPTTTTPAPNPISTPAKADPLISTSKAIEKAARAYFVTTNRTIQDATALADLKASFTPTCQQCATDLSNISKIHAAQKKITGGEYKILDVVAQANHVNSGTATITFSTASDIIYDRNGKILERDPAQPKQSAGLTFVKRGPRWLVVGWIDFGKIT